MEARVPPTCPPPKEPDTDPKEPGTIAKVRAIVGLASVVVGTTFMCGAIILAGQMLFADLPSIGVVGAVPRENALARGASLVIGPAILVGIIYAVSRSTFFPGRKPSDRFTRFGKLPDEKGVRAAWYVELLVLIGVLGGPPVLRFLMEQPEQSLGWLALILLAVVLSALGFLHGRGRAGEKWTTKEGWNGVWAVSTVACVLAAATVPSLVAFWAVGKLPKAVVCLRATDGHAAPRIVGLLVGQTSDSVYLGNAKGALSTFPSDVVERVVVGGTGTEACSVA